MTALELILFKRLPENTLKDCEVRMVPSVETCLRLMKKYRMLENIKAHSVVVARTARLIAGFLLDHGAHISVKKVTAGALMHDIGKTISLKSGQDHAEIGRHICLVNNLDEIADIVGDHIRLSDYNLDCDYSEKEIVYYADKRVNHDRVVSLDERMSYILERYGRNQKKYRNAIKENFDFCRKVEQKLFKKLDFGPDLLSHMTRDEKIEGLEKEGTES